jgi:two-component sensor histidine kinase
MTLTDQLGKSINFLHLEGRWLFGFQFFLAMFYGGVLLLSIGAATQFLYHLERSVLLNLIGLFLVFAASILLWPILMKVDRDTNVEVLKTELNNTRDTVSALEQSKQDLEADLEKSKREVQNVNVRHSMLLRKYNVATFRCDLDHRYVWAENCWLGDLEIIGKSDEEIFPRDVAEELRALKARALEEGGVQEIDLCLASEAGAHVLSVQVAAVHDSDGNAVGTAIVSCDVTERNTWRNHLMLLMKEVNHRSRNTLAVLSAICSLTGSRATNAEVFQKRMKGRIDCLAGTLNLLGNSNWAGSSMQQIVNCQLHFVPDALRQEFAISGPDVQLNPKAVQSIGLVIHELAVNALCHGALSRGTGQVQVTWRICGPTENQILEIVWRESGSAAPQEPAPSGFGHYYLDRLAGAELGGSSRYIRNAAGVTYKLEVAREYFSPPGGPAADESRKFGKPFEVDNALREEFNRLLLETASKRVVT